MLGLGNGLPLDSRSLVEIFSNEYSLQFNGSTESVQIDSITSELPASYGTFVTWIKLDAMSGSTTIIQASVDTDNFIRLWWNDANTRIKATIKQGGTASTAQDDSASHVVKEDGLWYHVAVTWDITADDNNGEIKLYVNSVLQQTTAIGGDWAGTLSAADIAKNSVSDAAYFAGNIDEVAAYSIALPVGEIAVLYNGGSAMNYEFSTGSGNLVGYWRFNEGTGTTTYDESGAGNTGTLINTPTWSTDTP